MIAIPVIETQKVPISYPHGITLYIKREDKTHVHVSGNKYRKLKYNLLEATQKGYQQLITFGGAYSNHIAATAYAGKVAGIETIGVIRGEPVTLPTTLPLALLRNVVCASILSPVSSFV